MATTQKAQSCDRRVIRTRKAIMDAFDKLVVADDVEKITVSAIAREANIDRKTFYLHYSSIDDLVNFKAESSLERIIGTLKEKAQHLPFPERMHIALEEVNAILTENINVYTHIASRLSSDQIFSYFINATESAIESSGYISPFLSVPQGQLRMQFYISGALSLYTSWLKTDHSQPIETISAVIEESIRQPSAF